MSYLGSPGHNSSGERSSSTWSLAVPTGWRTARSMLMPPACSRASREGAVCSCEVVVVALTPSLVKLADRPRLLVAIAGKEPSRHNVG